MERGGVMQGNDWTRAAQGKANGRGGAGYFRNCKQIKKENELYK